MKRTIKLGPNALIPVNGKPAEPVEIELPEYRSIELGKLTPEEIFERESEGFVWRGYDVDKMTKKELKAVLEWYLDYHLALKEERIF